ncbi:MAG: insulinase family protein [Archangium sp.]
MRRLVVVLCVSVLTACAGVPRGPVLPDTQFRMREFKLANGLRVIVEEDHATPLVGVFTVVGVGSSGDPEGKAGLAHLLEHLAFRAKPGNKDTAWNQLEGAGVGFLNASTSFDETIYMNVGTRDLLPKLLAIEVGRMVDPLNGVDAAVVDVEREVVRNELRQRGENSIGPAFNYLSETVFPPGHPYARPIGGSHESLTAITFDDVKKFALKNYTPTNMTMLIIGDVDLETVDQVIKKALPSPVFEPRPAKTATPSRLPAVAKPPPEPPGNLMITKNATVSSPELYVVWSLPRAFDADSALFQFLTSKANSELASAAADPDVVSIGAFPITGIESSMLVVQAKLKEGDNPQRSLQRILDQMVKLWAGAIAKGYEGAEELQMLSDEAEFTRGRNHAAVQLTVAAENIMERGVSRASAAHFTGDPLTYGRQIKGLAQVSASQVSAYAEKYLKRDRARALLVLPFASTDKASANGAAGLAPSEAIPMTTELSPERVRELGQAHTARAKMETVVTSKREHIETTLPNGLKVVIHKRNYALPVAAVQLTFTHGRGDGSPPGATEVARFIASPKSKHFDGAFGIEWGWGTATDLSFIAAQGASGNVPNMLAHLNEYVTTMNVDTGALDWYRREFESTAIAGEQLPVARAARATTSALFRGHPWGNESSLADAKKLGVGDIEGWFERAWSPESAVLVVTGDIEPETTLLQVQEWLGGWKKVSNPFPTNKPMEIRNGPVELIVTPQANATQAQVTLACLADASSGTRTFANEIVGSVIGTALFEKIRGELGASYGFHGGSNTYVGGVGRINVNGSIENGRLPQAMAVMAKVMKNFETDTLTDRALERARWDVARSATMAQATSPMTAEVFTRRVLAGHKTTELDIALFDSLAGIKRDEVIDAWKQCHGHMVLSIVGDQARIAEATKGVGF